MNLLKENMNKAMNKNGKKLKHNLVKKNIQKILENNFKASLLKLKKHYKMLTK